MARPTTFGRTENQPLTVLRKREDGTYCDDETNAMTSSLSSASTSTAMFDETESDDVPVASVIAHWTFEYKVNAPGSEYRIVSNNGYSSFWFSVAKVTVDVAIKYVLRVLEELRFCRVEDDVVFSEFVALCPDGLPRKVDPVKIALVCNALSAIGILSLDLSRLCKEWSFAYKSEVGRNNNEPLRIRGSAAALLMDLHRALNLPGEKLSVGTAVSVLSGVAAATRMKDADSDLVTDVQFVKAVDILVRGSCKAAKLRTEAPSSRNC